MVFRRSSRRESMNKDESVDKTKASTSEVDGENGVNLGNYVSSLLPGFMGSDGIVGDVDMGDLVNKPSTLRSRMPLRSRRARAIRPLSALESCLMAQVEVKDYTSSLFASPSAQTVRLFFVTNGHNVISRSGDAKIIQNSVVEKKLQRHSEENIGSSDAMLLQKENLVLDEDEIKMKDSLVMHELIIDDHKSQRTGEQSPEGENKESAVMKTKDDSFSKIEAELKLNLEVMP
ncbi:polar localization during asymmetric division and redistribution like protein [Tanacetum coccineum]